jgi:small multidrug resistance pump
MGWFYLAAAILSEITATLALRGVASGWRWWPGVLVVVGYGVAFALLALALRTVTVGAAYAIWSGVGTAGVAVVAWLLYGERITPLGAAGIVLIVAGVVVLSLSGSAAHG